MTTAGQRKTQGDGNGATTGYETELWRMADALRGSMDAAEYKHVVLGLIFLKYISDAFEETYARLAAEGRPGRRPRGPGRVPRPEHLLGPAGGAVALSEGRRPASLPSAGSWTTR